MKVIKIFIGTISTLLVVSTFSGCSTQVGSTNTTKPSKNEQSTMTQMQTSQQTQISNQTKPQVTVSSQAQPQSSTSSQTSTTTEAKLQPLDAAKAASNVDNQGSPYFLAYDYDATNYLVSAYTSQQSPGVYSGGAAVYLVNISTGKVKQVSSVDQIGNIDWSKYLAVYTKVMNN